MVWFGLVLSFLVEQVSADLLLGQRSEVCQKDAHFFLLLLVAFCEIEKTMNLGVLCVS